MKTTTILLAPTLLLAFIGAACSRDEVGARETVTSGDVREETAEAWTALKGYAFERRVDLEQKLATELEELKRDIEDLGQKIANASKDVPARTDEAVAGLRTRAADCEDKLEKLRTQTAETWDKARDEVVDEMAELERSIETASDER